VTYLSAAEWQWLGIHACVRLGQISSAYIFRAGAVDARLRRQGAGRLIVQYAIGLSTEIVRAQR